MSTDITDRVRDAYDDIAPSEETDREVLEEIERCTQVAPARRRWEIPIAAAAAVVVVAVLLMLPGEPEPGPAAAQGAPGLRPWESTPVASALSKDGRFRLDITHCEVEPPAPGSVANPKVKIQGRVVIDGPRLVAPRISVRGVTQEGYWYSVSAPWWNFAIHGLDFGPEPETIALLELETTILRLGDLDHRFEGIRPGEPVRKLVPPYELTFSAERPFLQITSFVTDESIRAAKADLKDPWPGNLAVASSARIVDATGEVLVLAGPGGGSGGHAMVSYGAGWIGNKDIAYPVTITVPDPTPVERIPVVFRFRDLALPPVRDRRVSASPWGESVAGLTMRADVPTRVEQGERIAATIEVTPKATGLPTGVTRLETRDIEAFLTLRLIPEGGGEEVIVRPDDPTMGLPDPPEPGEPEPNLDRDLAIRVEFPLVRARDRLPPGRYAGVLELSMPDEGSARLWRGTLRSGRFGLEIVAEPARIRTLRLPTRLRLVKGLGLTYRSEDSEDVIIPRRNGYFLGTRVGLGTEEDDARFEGLSSGAPIPDAPSPLYILRPDHRGPFEEKVTIVVFHTVDPPVHLWGLTHGHEVLWRRTFVVSCTAEEIDALR